MSGNIKAIQTFIFMDNFGKEKLSLFLRILRGL